MKSRLTYTIRAIHFYACINNREKSFMTIHIWNQYFIRTFPTHSLLISHLSRLTTYHLPPTTQYSPLTTHYSLLTVQCTSSSNLPLTPHPSPLTTHHLPITIPPSTLHTSLRVRHDRMLMSSNMSSSRPNALVPRHERVMTGSLHKHLESINRTFTLQLFCAT